MPGRSETPIVIRATEPADAEGIHTLMSCPGVTYNTLQLPWRSLEERRERASQGGPGVHRLVATIDGQIVGTLGLNIEQVPRRHGCAWFGMGVHDDFQRQGVGSALMTAMLELADNWLVVRRLELTVFVDNTAAVHLYK